MRIRIVAATVAAATVVSMPAAASAVPSQGGQGRAGGAGQQVKMRQDCSRTSVTGTLTAPQVTTLQAMAEEEKLAHDVYVTLAEEYPGVFDRIASSESRHLAALRKLMRKYGVADPTSGLEVGRFASKEVQELFAALTSVSSYAEARAVGAQIERMDIADLKSAIAETKPRDLKRVYTNLLRGSGHHLVAFTR